MHLQSSFRAFARLFLLALALAACAKSEEGARPAVASNEAAASGGVMAWKKAPFIAGRLNHAMATLGSKVVVFGGRASNTYQPPARAYDDTWEWDGLRWLRRHPRMSPSARDGACAAVLDGKMVLFGGLVGKRRPFRTRPGSTTV